MKLTFRDLKQQKFTIDAEPSETIAQVKAKIEQEKGWEAGQQKLIYSGKILADANTVESYNIEEKGFIVCMVSKPKAAPAAASSKAAPSTPAPAQTSTPVPPAAPQPAPVSAANPPATPTPAPAASAPPAAAHGDAPSFNDPSALLVGQQSEGAIAQMEAMGFPRSEIDRAMRAAFYNPDRAVEYLLSGIPENVRAEEQSAQPRARQAGATPQAAPASRNPQTAQPASANPDEPVNLFEAAAQAGGGGNTGGRTGGARSPGAGLGAAAAGLPAGATSGDQVNMEFLRTNPHFQQLRQLVQQSPQLLEPILQQVAEGNPQLAQMIGANQDQFLQLLSEDLEGGEGQGALPPGATTISVTEEERDAIERLCRLGFPRDAVVQAYFACDKNEELAANYLFDQPDEDDAQ